MSPAAGTGAHADAQEKGPGRSAPLGGGCKPLLGTGSLICLSLAASTNGLEGHVLTGRVTAQTGPPRSALRSTRQSPGQPGAAFWGPTAGPSGAV